MARPSTVLAIKGSADPLHRARMSTSGAADCDARRHFVTINALDEISVAVRPELSPVNEYIRTV